MIKKGIGLLKKKEKNVRAKKKQSFVRTFGISWIIFFRVRFINNWKKCLIRLLFFIWYAKKKKQSRKKIDGFNWKNQFWFGVFENGWVYMKIYLGSKRHTIIIKCWGIPRWWQINCQKQNQNKNKEMIAKSIQIFKSVKKLFLLDASPKFYVFMLIRYWLRLNYWLKINLT